MGIFSKTSHEERGGFHQEQLSKLPSGHVPEGGRIRAHSCDVWREAGGQHVLAGARSRDGQRALLDARELEGKIQLESETFYEKAS